MQSKDNLLSKGRNPESLPGRGSFILLSRTHSADSLVCSQGHCSGQYGTPSLLPSKASSHSLHSDCNPIIWNAQHTCNKALWAKEKNTSSECIMQTYFRPDLELA